MGDGAAAVDHRKCAADLMDSAADMTVVSVVDMTDSAADMKASVAATMVSVADTMAVSAADMMAVSAADMTVVSAADTMAVSAADMTGSVVDPIISVEAVTTTFAEWMADSADVVGADAADSAKVEITDPINY